MTLNEAIEAKAIPEAYIVWWMPKREGYKFSKWYACDTCSQSKYDYIKGYAKAFENLQDAEKRCVEIYDEISPELLIEAGVDTIRVA